MTFLSCETKRDCNGIGVIFSAIVAIVAAFLQITAVITVTPIFYIVAFGIAITYLAFLLIAIALTQNTNCNRCICSSLSTLLISILGVVVFAIILLAVSFAATSVIGAIVLGLLVFFFALTLTSTACLVKCLANCND